MLALMIIGIVFIVLCIAGIIAVIFNDMGGEGLGFLGAALLIGVAMVIFGSIGVATEAKEYTKLVCEIVSLDSNTTEFTMGVGKEDGTAYYFYRCKGSTFYNIGKQKFNSSNIIETNEVEPCIYEIKEKGKLNSYYNIYVPYNTVIVSYSIK